MSSGGGDAGGGGLFALGGAAEMAAASVAFAVGALGAYHYYTGAEKKTYQYVTFAERYDDDGGVVALDCSHPRLPTLSHQRGARNPPGLKPRYVGCGMRLLWVVALLVVHGLIN
jgi:hypothetical protein